MVQLFYTAREAAASALLLLPIFLILRFFRFHSSKTTLLYFFFAVYLSGVYAVVGLPNVSYIRFDLNLNLIPFVGMLTDLRSTALNIVLFIPLGFFLFLLWKPFHRAANMLLAGFMFSLAIELLQIFTLRATDINDLITNTAGAMAGYGFCRILAKVHPSFPGRNRISDLILITGISMSVMFFFQPLIWKLI